MRFNQAICTLLFILLILLPVSNTAFANEIIIDTDNVNVRTGPGVHFDKIKQVHKKEVYQMIQQQDNWFEIQLSGDKDTGWITTEYVTMVNKEDDLDKQEQVENEDSSITIINDNTHIRNGPSTENDIIAYVNNGEEYEVISEEDDWYEIKLDDQKGYLFKALLKQKQNDATSDLQNKTIVIDAGHGGRDVGSIGQDGTYEKDLTYQTVQYLKQELSILGAEVILTRTDDEYISLGSRASLSNHHDTDAFISIHYNSFPESPSVTGIGSYYYHDQNKRLANYIQKELINETDAKDRDIAFEDFQVLRQNYKPAVLLELGFISNSEREQLLLTNGYQGKLVSGIVNGLRKYFAH